MAAIQPLPRLGQALPAPDDPSDPSSPSYQALLLRKQMAELLAKRGEAGQGGNLSIGGGIRELGYAFGDQQRQADLLRMALAQNKAENTGLNDPRGNRPDDTVVPPVQTSALPPAPAAPAPQQNAALVDPPMLALRSAQAQPYEGPGDTLPATGNFPPSPLAGASPPATLASADNGSSQLPVSDPQVLAARDRLARTMAAQPHGNMIDTPPQGGRPPLPFNSATTAAPSTEDAGTPPIILAGARGEVLPSQQPLPAAPPPRDIGGEPIQPPPLPLYPQQKYLLGIMNNPNYSPEGRAQAAERFKILETQRLEQQSRQLEMYKNLREKRDQDLERNRGDVLNDPQKRLQLEQLRNTNRNAPLETQKLELGNIKTQQEIMQGQNAFDTITGPDNETLIRLKGASPETPFMPAPGSLDRNAPTNIRPNESQAKLIDLAGKALIASRQAIGTNFTALAGLNDVTKGYIPIGANYIQSDAYKSQVRAASAWVNANIRKESGANFSAGELTRDYGRYFPIPGDGPRQIAEKAEARRSVEELNAVALGNARPILDSYVDTLDQRGMKTEAAKPPVTVSGPDDPVIETLLPGRRIIDATGRQGAIQFEPRLKPRAVVR